MKPLLLFLGLVVAAVSSRAADRTPLLGVWKLVSYQTEFQDGTPKRATFGEHPSGYIVFTREGRMMAVLEAEARNPLLRCRGCGVAEIDVGIYRQIPHGWKPMDHHRGCGLEPGLAWNGASAIV